MSTNVIVMQNLVFKHNPERISKNPCQISQISTHSSFLPNHSNNAHLLKLNLCSRASAEGTPFELIEDSKFVPIDTADLKFGPPALLLLGFEQDSDKIQQLLKDLDGEFLQVIYCTEEMIKQTLWDAMNTIQPNLAKVKIAKSLPRICFLSGLSAEEAIMFIDAFEEAGIEAAAFAALVPNSADKPIEELIEEIMADHELLSGKQSASVS